MSVRRLEIRVLSGRPAEVRTPEDEYAFIKIRLGSQDDATPQLEHAQRWLDYRTPFNGLLGRGEMRFATFAPAAIESGRRHGAR